MATYESYCRERKARIDRERALGKSRSMNDIVDELLEITSSDDDALGRGKGIKIKRGPISGSWSLSSNSIITTGLGSSSESGVGSGGGEESGVLKSIQSYTGQLFSPVYEVTNNEHNIFQENRRPLPKPGQTPKCTNISYVYAIEKRSPEDSPSSSGGDDFDAATTTITTDVVASSSLLSRPVPSWKTLLSKTSTTTKGSISSSIDEMIADSPPRRRITSPPNVVAAAVDATARAASSHDLSSIYMRKEDWSFKSSTSGDSGQLSLEPLHHMFEYNLRDTNNEMVCLADCLEESGLEHGEDISLTDPPLTMTNLPPTHNDQAEPATESDDQTAQLTTLETPPLVFEEQCSMGQIVAYHKEFNTLRAEQRGHRAKSDAGSHPRRLSAAEAEADKDLQIINVVDPTPDRLFVDLIYKSFAALTHITIDAWNMSHSSLGALCLSPRCCSSYPLGETMLRHGVSRLVSSSIQSISGTRLQTQGMDNELCFVLDQDLLCLRLSNWNENVAGTNVSQRRLESSHSSDNVDSLETSSDLLLSEVSEVIKVGVAAPLVICSDSDSNEMNSLAAMELDSYIVKGTDESYHQVQYHEKDQNLSGRKKMASKISPTFSYDSHLASLGSSDYSTESPPHIVDMSISGKTRNQQLSVHGLSSLENGDSVISFCAASELEGDSGILDQFPSVASSQWMSEKGSKSSSDNNDILKDFELRAVMKLTRNGENVSSIFPTFSYDSLYTASCESDDGLDSELDALQMHEEDLRQEIEAAESLISLPWTNPMIPAKETWDSSVAQFNHTEDDVESSYSREVGAVRRRVHFNEEVQEFHFIKEAREEGRRRSDKDESIFDDVLGVFDELIEELSFVCVSVSRAMDRTRSYRSARRSAVY